MDWPLHLKYRQRKIAYVFRHSKGGIPLWHALQMEPDQVDQWFDAIEWLIRQEYPEDKK